MRCHACGEEVPEGRFCTRCGAHQVPGRTGRGSRVGHFAANPDEHVGHPAIITSLFPHLGHGQVNEFRWALFAGVIVLLMLYLAGLITAALLAAAFLVPTLYVMYLYEVRVYRDAPLAVIGFTIGGGAILGVVVTLVVNRVVGPTYADVSPLGAGISLTPLLLTGVVVPLIQEVVKPLPALALHGRREFGETIDGLVFGVAAGLGFALAQTVVQFSQLLTALDVRTDPANWLFPLLTAALLLPLLHGSATGAITAALWRGRGRRSAALGAGAVVVAVLAHIAFVLGGQLILAGGSGQILVLLWQAMVVAALVIFVRYVLHVALLDEATALGFASTTCPNCRRDVTAAGFCPNCGMALIAVPTAVRDARQPVTDSVQPTKAGD
ncbi:MAG: PrsW family glutamic-type intramembrane protease [Chloroflexota bacterium]|nr:PrsW family glutamic-type intramembrane protease [Chloroflexota bacterium]